MDPVYEVDLTYIETKLDNLVLLSEQNQLLINDLYHLGIWFIGGVTGVFILVLLYSIITKFAR